MRASVKARLNETAATGGSGAIRPFRVNIPEAALSDLRRRLVEARLPAKETVCDYSQGVPLKTIEQVLYYWRTHYNWRTIEARLNSYPQFITEIDGLDIHFTQVRSKHKNALPLIVTHGWPGSIVEQLKIIEPLTNPTAHGATGSDAFHIVIPSMPGYGFSGKPTTTGWGPERIASAWVTLMRRLGYKHFVAQGGDWGAVVTDLIGVQAPPELLGIHTNMPGAIPADIDQASLAGAPVPSGLSAEEKSTYEQLVFFYKHVYYAFWMATRPQTGAAFADSPIGLATFLLDHDARSLELIARSFDGQVEGLTPDDVLDNITLFWLTNTGVSASRLYWENKLGFFVPRVSKSRLPSVSFRTNCTRRRGVGQSGLIQISSTTTRWKRAAILLPGNSRRSSPKSCARLSDHSGNQFERLRARTWYARRSLRQSIQEKLV
jgi:pimeloyl-ACP methyl ester carboxylesterase